jgi:charged multivesicular body protein 2A
VRLRGHGIKLLNLTTQLRAASTQMSSVAATQQVAESMRNAARALHMLNNSINLPHLRAIMMQFAKQSQQLDMKQEMMSDTIADSIDSADSETESDEVINQVLDEIGIKLADDLVDVPLHHHHDNANKAKDKVKDSASNEDLELEARLNALSKP